MKIICYSLNSGKISRINIKNQGVFIEARYDFFLFNTKLWAILKK